MTEPEAIQAIYLRWTEGWADLHARDADTYPAVATDPSFVPFALKNETFDKTQLGELGAWIRVSVVWSGGEQTTQGEAPFRQYDRTGIVFVNIFAPPNQGVALLSLLSHQARLVLQSQSIDELHLHAGASGNPVDDKPDWAMQTVTIPFTFEETG